MIHRLTHPRRIITVVLLCAVALLLGQAAQDDQPGKVECANLTYGSGKSSVCFSDRFLTQTAQDTSMNIQAKFARVNMDSTDLFEHPFAVMSGEGAFTLTTAQRDNLKNYLLHGGFIVGSAGCSSSPWNRSFKEEIARIFPDVKLKLLEADHPVFHTVYDITQSKYKSGGSKLPALYGLELDGRIVLIHSPDGLNDTAHAGGNCCCCGGNEIKSALQVNVNLLTYALTH